MPCKSRSLLKRNRSRYRVFRIGRNRVNRSLSNYASRSMSLWWANTRNQTSLYLILPSQEMDIQASLWSSTIKRREVTIHCRHKLAYKTSRLKSLGTRATPLIVDLQSHRNSYLPWRLAEITQRCKTLSEWQLSVNIRPLSVMMMSLIPVMAIWNVHRDTPKLAITTTHK